MIISIEPEVLHYSCLGNDTIGKVMQIGKIKNSIFGGKAVISHWSIIPQSAIIKVYSWVIGSMMEPKKVRPDSKGRISLGDLAKGVSSFSMTSKNGKIILEPFSEIPARERWIYEDKEVLASLKRGIADAKAGRIKPLDLSKFK